MRGERLAIDGEPYEILCDAPVHARAVARWARLLPPAAGAPVHIRLRTKGVEWPQLELEGRCLRPVDHPDDLLPVLEGVLYERLRRPGRGRVLLHAAVLARRGRAALFFGPSGAGKSVLAARLARRGWSYLSDEFAPVDAEGRVHALPRPVTFDASELPPALWSELSRGLPRWSAPVRGLHGESTHMLHLLPQREPPKAHALPVGAVFRLQPRPGTGPALHRLSGSALRAFLFGVTEKARMDLR